jgi:hypothetical protein
MVKKFVMIDSIEEVWRNEVLINWQNYWDSLNKRLRNIKISLNFDEKEK